MYLAQPKPESIDIVTIVIHNQGCVSELKQIIKSCMIYLNQLDRNNVLGPAA